LKRRVGCSQAERLEAIAHLDRQDARDYQITNQLGKGGMGEVFQAKDQVLGRDVAIKVLPEEFARDIEFLPASGCPFGI